MPEDAESRSQQGPEPTQLSQPEKGEPIEIPVPKEKDVLGLLERMARTPAPERDDEDEKPAAT